MEHTSPSCKACQKSDRKIDVSPLFRLKCHIHLLNLHKYRCVFTITIQLTRDYVVLKSNFLSVCVKMLNECSEYFETRQGLRQGNVLSTLIFNVVRQAKSQTNGSILGYAEDIDIISKSQAAVQETL
jgi:hypothetical protein